MIKVLYFMDGLGNAGGIQEMALKWMKYIDHSMIQIDILSYNHIKPDNYTERVNKLGGKVYVIESFQDKGMFWKSLKQTKEFFKEHPDYDILHAHSSSKAFFVLLAAKLSGVKVRVLHSHATQFVMTGKFPLFVANFLKGPAKWVATNYMACSPEAGDFLFGKEERMKGNLFIAHNAIDTNAFKASDDARKNIRKEFGFNDNTFVVGNVGRFRPQKNHRFLIKIFKAVIDLDPTARMVCVGGGELEEDIHLQAKELGIYDKIIFTGIRSDVKDVMQAFDLLVMPSLFEGLPVTGVEAQAVGTPALFADSITVDAPILPSSGFFPLKASPEEWAKKVLSYKGREREDKPERWIKEKRYDIVHESKRLEQFYIDLVNK